MDISILNAICSLCALELVYWSLKYSAGQYVSMYIVHSAQMRDNSGDSTLIIILLYRKCVCIKTENGVTIPVIILRLNCHLVCRRCRGYGLVP